MSYISLSNLKKKIEKGENFTLTVEPKVYNEKCGVAINFLDKPPQSSDEESNILFHFNPRPPNKIILNSHWQGEWQKEVVLEDDDVQEKLFGRPFELTIKVLSHDEKKGSEFLVFVNKTFQTTFACPADITHTEYIGFSPALRISADVKDF
ncbi:uncharacterized protein LOC111132306 [Crassostrea virginica]